MAPAPLKSILLGKAAILLVLLAPPACAPLESSKTVHDPDALAHFAPPDRALLSGLFSWKATWWPTELSAVGIRSQGTCRFLFDPTRDLLVGHHEGEIIGGAFSCRLLLGSLQVAQPTYWGWENSRGEPVLHPFKSRDCQEGFLIRRMVAGRRIEEQLLAHGVGSLEYRQFRFAKNGRRFLYLRVRYRRP